MIMGIIISPTDYDDWRWAVTVARARVMFADSINTPKETK